MRELEGPFWGPPGFRRSGREDTACCGGPGPPDQNASRQSRANSGAVAL
ncbi:hypothetical protein [uncultured Oscillibacter sp.]|nr:hypothetical protein [uncultured Oscillibacter sp.]